MKLFLPPNPTDTEKQFAIIIYKQQIEINFYKAKSNLLRNQNTVEVIVVE